MEYSSSFFVGKNSIFAYSFYYPNTKTMKKITLFAAVALLLASCNRDTTDVSSDAPAEGRTNVVHYDQSDLDGMLIPMNQSFNISSKAAVQLNYTYRAYAEPVTIAGHTMAASAIYSEGDIVFVTWHSASGLINPGASSSLAGSICAYKQTGIGQYTFMDRIDFTDADYHEVTAHTNSTTGHIEVFAVGQRAMTSGYLLAGHNGAIVTRVDYDYINDEFWEPGVKELPLPGVSANDIEAGASHLYIVTGDGIGGSDGGVYEIDRSLAQVKKVDNTINDGVAIIADPTSTNISNSDMYVLDRDASDKYTVRTFNTQYLGGSSTTWNSSLSFVSDGVIGSNIDRERSDLTWAQWRGGVSNPSDSLIISAGLNGIYRAGSGANDITSVKDLGPCLSTTFDPGLSVLYYADGDDGVFVLAMDNFEGGALINTYDIIGQFTPPTGGVFPSDFLVKEMTVYQTRNLALAAGEAGVYFMQRDKN